jgi:hypothetical protein
MLAGIGSDAVAAGSDGIWVVTGPGVPWPICWSSPCYAWWGATLTDLGRQGNFADLVHEHFQLHKFRNLWHSFGEEGWPCKFITLGTESEGFTE